MLICPNCKQKVGDDFTVCPYCAKPLLQNAGVVAFCRTCGRPLDPATMCCPVCVPLRPDAQANPIPQPVQPQDFVTQQPETAVPKQRKTGNKKTMLLGIGIAAAVLVIGIAATVILLLLKAGHAPTVPADTEIDAAQTNGLNYTMQQIEAEYQANHKLYDSVDLRLFGLSVSEENRAAAQKMLGEITDEDSFITLAYEYAAPEDKLTFENADATRLQGARYEAVRLNIAEDVADWLFDTARSTGDKHVCETDSYIFVLMIVRTAYREETPLVSARHILISYEDTANAIREQDPDAETNYTRTENTFTDNGLELTNQGTDYAIEVILESYNKARQIYDEFMAGDKTEEAFAILATLYSTDYGAEEGGLYSDIAKGQMVKPFEDWVYDGSRQPGDVGIVQTVYGWHVIYFVGSHAYPVWMEEAAANLSGRQ